MADGQSALAKIGIADREIRREQFGARPSINGGLTDHVRASAHPPPGPPGTGPMITFARSGLRVPFSSGQRSILELVDAATFLPGGPAGPTSVTPARLPWCPSK